MPPLSIRSPVASLRHLLVSRRWLFGFTIEWCGWALFVLALSLAPLSLVQATAAGHRHPRRAGLAGDARAALEA